MLGMPVSDDVNRYLWEGKLVAAGESPYRFPAEHDYYAQYRDDYWADMNHKDKLTAYPPLVELIFALVNLIAYSPWAFKAVLIIADLLVIGVLIHFLSQYALPLQNVFLYALNPITLFAIAGEAHFDVLMMLAILLSLLFAKNKSYGWSWVWLGIAIQIKIIAVVLIPYYLWRCSWRHSVWLLVPLILPSLYFADTLTGMLQGLWAFGGTNAFNGPLHGPINYLLDGQTTRATGIVMMTFATLMLWVMLTVKTVMKAAFVLIAGLVLLSPVVHYWYVLWIVPFVVIYPALSWLLVSLSSGAYFMSTFAVQSGFEWSLPVWAMWVIWLPFLVVLLYELRMVLLRRLKPQPVWPQPTSLAIVIPTLNEEEKIQACLAALQNQVRPADEIIVSDGGSTDRTIAIARSMGVSVIHSEKGRGAQIKVGVSAIQSDTVLIVHADCVCDKTVSQQIMQVLEQNPDVSGGAVGQRFDQCSLRLLLIEALNDARASLGGASFGDQGQFFRVVALNSQDGVPDYPLMEDVELGLRLLQAGRVVLLDGGVNNSARQWNGTFLHRVGLILRLVFVFRVNRWLGRNITQQLYENYYSQTKRDE